jgi:glycosyltransferase involved in cell wall biosynthesis
MRIAVTYGPMCLLRSAEETWNDPRTGSEIGWRRIVEGLEKLGHEVDTDPRDGSSMVYGATVAINEPDRLRGITYHGKRICMFWLNGFSFCKEGFDEHVDRYLSPSESHYRQAVGVWGAPVPGKWSWNLLGSDPAPSGHVSRVAGRAVYCSSPDRGLHRVLEAWPRIKRAAPHATLKIFYRLEPWLRQFDTTPYFPDIERNRARALYIEEALARLSGPEWGITVVDSVSHAEVLSEMRQAEVLLHPCETLSWSEGFSCTVADACASGAVPVISDCDALGEVYADLDPIPVGYWDSWRERVVDVLTKPDVRAHYAEKATALAGRLTWDAHVARLDEVIRGLKD